MRRRSQGALVALSLSVIVLTGCITASAPKSDADTLLVVPVSLDRTGIGTIRGEIPAAAYVLRIIGISHGTTNATVRLNPESNYAFLQGLPPGRYTISELEFTHADGKIDGHWPLNSTFTLAPRELTILDRDFVYHIRTEGAMTYFAVKNLPLSFSQATGLVSELTREGTLSHWKLSSETSADPAIGYALREIETPPPSGSKSIEFVSPAKRSPAPPPPKPAALSAFAAAPSSQTSPRPSPQPPFVAEWARTVRIARWDSWFNSIAVDGTGNVYATGFIRGAHAYDFGNGVTVRGANSAGGGENVLLVKYDPTGTPLWARSVTAGLSRSWYRSVAVDREGNVFAAGVVFGGFRYDFGDGVTLTGSQSNGPKANAVLVKYNPSGKTLWARTVSSESPVTSYASVAVGGEGWIYAAGSVAGTAPCSFRKDVTVRGAYAKGVNALLVKYDESGKALWARSATSGSYDSGFTSIALDRSGGVYAAGSIRGVGDFGFGDGILVHGANSAQREENPLLVKFDPSGTARWARSSTFGTQDSWFTSVAAGGSGEVYTAGVARGEGSVGIGNGQKVWGASPAGLNLLLAKYDESGSPLWGRGVNFASSESWTISVAVGPNGEAYLAAVVRGTGSYSFGARVTVTGTNAAGMGESPVAVKYNRAGQAQWALTIDSSSDAQFDAIAVDSAGDIYVAGSLRSTDSFRFSAGIAAHGVNRAGERANAFVAKYAAPP